MNVYNADVEFESRSHTCSYRFYKHLGVLYTEGVCWLAETLNCHWLITDIALFSRRFWKRQEFLTIRFKTPTKCKGNIEISDGDENILLKRHYDFTDLHIDQDSFESQKQSICLFLVFDGSVNKHVLLLPTEY